MTQIGLPCNGAHSTAEAVTIGQTIIDRRKAYVIIDRERVGAHHVRLKAVVTHENDAGPDWVGYRIESVLHAQHEMDGLGATPVTGPLQAKAIHEAIAAIGQPMRRNITCIDDDAPTVETFLRIWDVDLVKGMTVDAYGDRWLVTSVAATGAQPIVHVRSKGIDSTLNPGAITAVHEEPNQTKGNT